MSVPWGRGFEQVSGDDYQMSVAGGGRSPGSMLGGRCLGHMFGEGVGAQVPMHHG